MKYMPNNWGLNYEQEGELMQELSLASVGYLLFVCEGWLFYSFA